MNKQILLIANYKSVGGIAVQVKLLIEKLKSEKVNVTSLNTKGNFLYRLTLPFKLIICGWHSNIFHIHGCSNLGFFPIVLGTLIGKLLNKKIIVTYHGGGAAEYFAKHPLFIRFIFKRADKIIVLSKYLEKIFMQYGFTTHIVPNIINTNESQFVKRPTLSPKLISTRTLNPVYDIPTLIHAFEIVQKKYPDASLTIVGSGQDEIDLQKLVKDKALNNVYFTGVVNNEEIYHYLKNADFWCNPTTKDNMPVSLIEAINAGLVIISTDVGGIPYMVEHKKSAWLVKKGDFKGIADGIVYLLENQNTTQSLIYTAKSTLYQYKWAYIKEKLADIYMY